MRGQEVYFAAARKGSGMKASAATYADWAATTTAFEHLSGEVHARRRYLPSGKGTPVVKALRPM